MDETDYATRLSYHFYPYKSLVLLCFLYIVLFFNIKCENSSLICPADDLLFSVFNVNNFHKQFHSIVMHKFSSLVLVQLDQITCFFFQILHTFLFNQLLITRFFLLSSNFDKCTYFLYFCCFKDRSTTHHLVPKFVLNTVLFNKCPVS